MTSLFRDAALTAALLIATPALAQTATDHSAHHGAAAATSADQAGAQTQSAPADAGDRAAASSPGGMTGHGMMGHGMMQGGMMGRGGAGDGGMHGRAGRAIDHVEGRLAFIKAEVAITEAQLPQWNAFADAVRAQAKAMNEMHGAAMGQAAAARTLPERLELQSKELAAHLAAVNQLKAALDPLYAALTAEQKQVAEEVILGRMGMPLGVM
jgi:LTXXQ motif family protein